MYWKSFIQNKDRTNKQTVMFLFSFVVADIDRNDVTQRLNHHIKMSGFELSTSVGGFDKYTSVF